MSRPIPIEKMVRMFKSKHKTSHLFKIDNFSLLKNAMVNKAESSVFDLGGHKWKLIVYPLGSRFVDRHVHIFLENQAPINVNIEFEVFVVSQRKPLWHSSEKLAFGTSSTKKTMGTEKLILYEDLEKKGYLIDDCCMFGVKIFGIEPAKSGTAECFSLIEKPNDHKVTWKIPKLLSLDHKKFFHQSKEFVVGNRKWRIEVYPFMHMYGLNVPLSVRLVAKGFINNAPKTSTFVRVVLRVYDQVEEDHREETWSEWVSEVPDVRLGDSEFMPLKKLEEPYLVKDMMYVGVEFKLISVTNYC